MNFQNKVALITGAAVGIGRATALMMAEHGASLILMDMNAELLSEVKKEVQAYTEQVLTYTCDISDEGAVNDAVSKALTQVETIDILVNNAALWRSFASFTELSTETWRRFLDVNVMGTVYVTRAVLPTMIERSYGRIVNVASVAGVYGNRNMTHYSATKGAVISLTQALAKEVGDRGITVNAVSPGTVSPSEERDVDYTQPSNLSYLGRTGTCRENAELICFLASEGAGYISRQNVQIDGCRRKL